MKQTLKSKAKKDKLKSKHRPACTVSQPQVSGAARVLQVDS